MATAELNGAAITDFPSFHAACKAAMGFPTISARVHGYWSVIATGNAVVEWDLSAGADGAGAQLHA